MKTFNIRYRSIVKLKDFLENNAIYDHKKIFIQIFTSIRSYEKILTLSRTIQELLPSATIIGATTDGEIIDGKVLTDNTIISITIFEKTVLKSISIEGINEPFEKGIKLAEKLIKSDTKAIIILATFQGLNAQTLLDGLYHDSDKEKQFLVSGALAADCGAFKNSFVFDGKKVLKEGIVAISLSGKKLQVSNHYWHDWEPISRMFKVNKVHENRIYELDNKSIKTLYSQYIGSDVSSSLPFYSLQFPFVVKRAQKYVSKLAIKDMEDGSLIFTSNIKRGEILQIAFANITKAAESGNTLLSMLSKEPVESLFVYASSARRRYIEEFSHREIEMLSRRGVVSGFFGFSEFFARGNSCRLLSQSITLLALSESEEVVLPKMLRKKSSPKSNLNYETVKVLSNIAQVSSYELQEVNKKLEQRVRSEVRENRKKDSIMIHNSKLAQLGEMLGLIAHQWRQPLSAISATATGMQIKFELDSWTPEYVENSLSHIEEYVHHLSETINDFTNFFKPSKKKESVMIRDIIKKALFIMSPLLTKEGVLVIKKYNSDNHLETYPNEVVQVILNLIKNAVNAQLKRKVQNPEVYINEYHDRGKNIIEISDNAGGIDEAIIDKIFEPYFSTKNSENSMGLGLYMSRFIIEESCGGKLDVENIEGGVKFTIQL